MILTLDIGNTNIKSALFQGDQISEFVVHSSLENAINYSYKTDFTEAAICSVNPSGYQLLREKISSKNIPIFKVNSQNKFNLEIKYETPNTLGIDRICSAVGAFKIASIQNLLSENQYLITIDFGTATTINIVSPEKEFVGGLIAPGIKTMLHSLHDNTAQLPLPDPSLYKELIGNSTNTSIISGVINATVGMISQTLNNLKTKSDIDPVIFVTGGNSNFILSHLKYKVFYDEALVLRGLKFIYDMNKK